jgi:hypothetical protein
MARWLKEQLHQRMTIMRQALGKPNQPMVELSIV